MMYGADQLDDEKGVCEDLVKKDDEQDVCTRTDIHHHLDLPVPMQIHGRHRDSGVGDSICETPQFFLNSEDQLDNQFNFREDELMRETTASQHIPQKQPDKLGLATPPVAIPTGGRVQYRSHHEQRHAQHTPPRAYIFDQSRKPRFSTGSITSIDQSTLIQSARTSQAHGSELCQRNNSEMVKNAVELQRAKLAHTETHLNSTGRVAYVPENKTWDATSSCVSDSVDEELIRARRERRSMSTPCIPRQHVEVMFGRELRKIADQFHCSARGMGEISSGPAQQRSYHTAQSSSFPTTNPQNHGIWQHVIQFISPNILQQTTRPSSRPLSSMNFPDVVVEHESSEDNQD